VGDVECWISRIGYSGELGFELFCAQMDAPGLWRSLVARGARPYGFETVETLRVEAGLLLLGADFVSGRTNPYDVSLDTVIKLDKGDFVGREALAATAATPPRRLVTLVLAGEDVPPRGAGVLHGDRLVGILTSACRSPTIGRVIGLASVDRAHAAPGGAGLGLSIANAVVQATNGDWKVSRAPLGGARISVSWPNAKPKQQLGGHAVSS